MTTLQEQCKALLPLIQAGEEGKVLVDEVTGSEIDKICLEDRLGNVYDESTSFDDVIIKPEPKCVPWESIEEIPEEALNGWWKSKWEEA